MVLPVIGAAASTIARFVAKKGIQEAFKKYGKKAVKEAGKTNKAIDNALNKIQGVTPKTPGRASKKAGIIVGKKRVKADRVTQRIKGGGLGVAGTLAVTELTKDKPKPKPKAKAKAKNGKDPRVNPKDFPTYKKTSKSAVSFREAQRKAKRNKQKTFTWEGRRYNTTEK